MVSGAGGRLRLGSPPPPAPPLGPPGGGLRRGRQPWAGSVRRNPRFRGLRSRGRVLRQQPSCPEGGGAVPRGSVGSGRDSGMSRRGGTRRPWSLVWPCLCCARGGVSSCCPLAGSRDCVLALRGGLLSLRGIWDVAADQEFAPSRLLDKRGPASLRFCGDSLRALAGDRVF